MDNRLKSIVDNLENLKIGVDEPFRFHCTMCGKCCIDREDILLTPRDIYGMVKELQLTPPEFFKKYCESYLGSDSRIPIVRLKPQGSVKRCPLLKDRKCSVHNAKPVVCATFPMGRCISIDPETAEEKNFAPSNIQYIFTDPHCGDDAETHTVREWLGAFGIALDDEFFLKWHGSISRFGAIFRKAEKKYSAHTMNMAWTATFVTLYLDYDTGRDFMPQFEERVEKLTELLSILMVPKDGDSDE